MPLNETQLLARDAKRDIGAELLVSVRQMKTGKGTAVTNVQVPAIMLVPIKSGLSQPEFSSLLGASVRTPHDREQSRRQPTAAARTLITIAEQQPKVLKQVFMNLASV